MNAFLPTQQCLSHSKCSVSICWPELHPKSYRMNSILITLAFKTFHNHAPYSTFSTMARLSSRNLTQGWFLSQQIDHHLVSGSQPQKPKADLSHEPKSWCRTPECPFIILQQEILAVETRIHETSMISNYLSAGKSKRNAKLQSKECVVSQKEKKNQINWIFNKILYSFIYSSNWISTQALWGWHLPILCLTYETRRL